MDSTPTLDQLSTSSANIPTRINESQDALSPGSLYGRRASTTTGLTWGYYGGRYQSAAIANGTLALTASTTNYVVAAVAGGAVSVSTATTNWNSSSYIRLYKIVTGASAVTSYEDHRQAIGAAGGGGSFTGGTLTSALNEAPEVTLASAATVAIGAAAANSILVTGPTAITAFDSIADGAVRRITFGGALVLTHNATSLILPGAANITTAAGDVAQFLSLGSGNWRCVSYMRANGTPVVAGTPSSDEPVNAQTGTSYTYVTGDKGKLITHSNAAAIAATLPQAGGSFPAGWWVDVQNTGAGTLTITPTTSTIDGGASLALPSGQGVRIASDGTNYFTQRGMGAGASTGAVNVFTKNQSVAPSALTSGSTISVDASLSNNFKLVLATNATLSNPTNATDGMVVNIRIKQDATGSRTLAYGSAYKWPGGTAPVLSTAANAVDLLSMYYDSTDAVWACVLQKGFA